MKIERSWLTTVAGIGVLAVLGACASTPSTTPELERARDAVAKVETMPDSSTLASGELKEAQDTLRKAEDALREREPESDVAHLAYLAEQQAEIAEAKINEARALEDTKHADAERNAALAEARERQVVDAEVRADQAEADAARAKAQAAAAEADAAEAWRQVEEAQETSRGIVLTLGDVLFDTGGAVLKPGAQLLLDKLAVYLQQNPDARAIIEGHTDNVGSDAMNQSLSERRAASVAAALQARGVSAARLETVGLGEAYPVATNDTSAGREENRRVEVVLSDSKGVFLESARRTASIP
jgi:outer membrane protein OmpA-like peptidoglycan-associated protein